MASLTLVVDGQADFGTNPTGAQHARLAGTGGDLIRAGQATLTCNGVERDAAVSGTLSIGVGANTDDITIGKASQMTTFAGNVTINGTSFTVGAATLDVTDNLILVNDGAAVAGYDSGFLSERHNTDYVADHLVMSGTRHLDASPSTTTLDFGSASSSVDDYFNGATVSISFGALAGQTRTITDYVGSTKIGTLSSAFTATTVGFGGPISYSGTIATTTITGALGAAFLTQVNVGDRIILDPTGSPETAIVASITSDTVLDTVGNLAATHSGVDLHVSAPGGDDGSSSTAININANSHIGLFWDESADQYVAGSANGADPGAGAGAVTVDAYLPFKSLMTVYPDTGDLTLTGLDSAGQGSVFVYDDEGLTELYYLDGDGNKVKLTANGSVNAPAATTTLDDAYNNFFPSPATITVDAGAIQLSGTGNLLSFGTTPIAHIGVTSEGANGGTWDFTADPVGGATVDGISFSFIAPVGGDATGGGAAGGLGGGSIITAGKGGASISSDAGGNGGAVTHTGGIGGDAADAIGGVGGAVTHTGGVGGLGNSTTQPGNVGGAGFLVGGVGGANTDGTGGAGGAGSLTGGVGGAATTGTGGAGGAISIAGGVGGVAASGTGGAGGAVTLRSGAGADDGGSAGAVVIQSGAKEGAGVNGSLTIGDSGGTQTFTTIDIDASGAIGIGTNTDTGAINVGTGASVRTITIGNSTGATTVDIDAGSGGATFNAFGIIGVGDEDADFAINVGTSGERPIAIGNLAGATALDLDAGTGGVTIDTVSGGISIDAAAGNVNLAAASGTMDIDSSGNLDIESSAGTITIGGDDVAQNMFIGTGGAARAITVGNATSTTSLDFNAGTGGITMDSTGAGVITIGGYVQTGTIGLGTGGARIINIGNATGATSINVDAGTGGIDVDSGGVLTLDGAGASNFTTSSGAMTVSGEASLALNSTATGTDITLLAGSAAGATGRGSVIVGGASDVGRNSVKIYNGSNAATDAAELIMYSEAGTAYTLWIDTTGILRIEAADGKTTDTGGAVVGAQSA